MNILFASSEVHPFSKTGGLADMVGALGKALALAGHEVHVITPLYRGIREKFSNFELSFDWKLGPGGNGGVMYRVTEEYDHPYWSGPEYQLLDDAGHPDGKSRLTAAGSDYALYPSPAGVVKPADQWNSSLIVVQGNHVQHWMNGQKLLEYDLLSPDWLAKVKASKFGAWPNYGRATTGYIAIQGDHNGVLAMRNIKIRVLK